MTTNKREGDKFMKKKILVLLLLLTIVCSLIVVSGCDLISEYLDNFVYARNYFDENSNSYSVVGVRKTNITTAKIPSEHYGLPVTGVGYNYEWSFSRCKDLTSVELPDTITSIQKQAFMLCYNLESINISEGVTSIGEAAFSCCNLKTLEIPDSVISIGKQAFSANYFENDLYIPSSVESIGESAFYGSGFNSVTVDKNNSKYKSDGNCLIETKTNKMLLGGKNSMIPNYVTKIDSEALYPGSMESIMVHKDNAYYIGDGNCLIEKATNKLIAGCKNSAIPNSVTSISDYAFEMCSGLKNVIIPSSVTEISCYAFRCCSGLEIIEVDANNEKYKSEENCLIEKNTNTMILGCKNSVIPDYATGIGTSAFSGCSGLTSIKIPASVTSIGFQAFWECSNLTKIVIPSSVAYISYAVFHGCDNLTIYCEADDASLGWVDGWNDDLPVVWGYKE